MEPRAYWLSAALLTRPFKALCDNWNTGRTGRGSATDSRLDRRRLRVCSFMHVAETRQQALENVKFGLDAVVPVSGRGGRFGDHSAWYSPILPSSSIETGVAMIGTPEDAIAHIERIYRIGEFGAHLIFGHDWADWEQTKRSYELIARYVMPHFNDGFATRRAAYDFNLEHRESQLAELEKGKPANGQKHSRGRLFTYAHRLDRTIKRFHPRFWSK